MLARMLRLLSAYPEREQVAIVAPVQADDAPPAKAAATMTSTAATSAAPAAPTAKASVAATSTQPVLKLPAAPSAPPAARWRLLPSTIASGALVNVAAADTCGGFDARLFVDYLDHDFCLRLRKMGFQILEASEVRMLPPVGRVEIPLAGKPEPTEPYSPVRRYYITRNRMLLWRRYRRFDRRWVWSDMRAFVREIFTVMLWERDVGAKLRMMLRGFVDAVRNVRGELQGHRR
jgi:rhamnosyltransferase